ncbi:MAG: electron transport complex subunit RsxC [Colwellia sp.]
MNSILERIKNNRFWTFHGGINPPEQKQITSTKPIRQLTLPEELIIPLQQHIGNQGKLLVKAGDKVLKGQPLTQSHNPMEVPVHAPSSGIITAIKKSVIAHPSGLSELCVFLQTDGKDKWVKRTITSDFRALSPEFIIQKIADYGIAGMGGAGFPTNIKITTKAPVNFLIINAVECEPYITADDLLMREQSSAIVDGIEILDHVLKPAFILIGIEDNKPEAIQALKKATAHIEKINVCVIPSKYPSGGEKQLIKILTGKEVESGKHPISAGIVMQNVGTCFAINDAIINDIPLIRRVVTVSGQGLSKPQNVWAPIGTTIKSLLEQCGFHESAVDIDNNVNGVKSFPVIMGGPMMGFSLSSDIIPIVKTTNCILAPSKKEMPSAFEHESKEVECIRCGQCADVCPSKLLPQELQWSAKAKDYEQLNKLNLFDCIDCGACAYVCPSQIPLVQYYRVAKAEIRQQSLLDLKAEHAKQRFEARKLRLEKEKQARQAKHKKAAEARKAAMNKNTEEASGAKSAVAAALARVKAKKLASKSNNDAVKVNNTPTETSTVNTTPEQDNKKKVSAAVMKAKEKAKLKAQEKSLVKAKIEESELNNETSAELTAEEKKNQKLAAAVARAKAKAKEKALAEPKEKPESKAKTKAETEDGVELTAEEKKKQKLAAAVARAKAKAKEKALAKPKEKTESKAKAKAETEDGVELTAEEKKKQKLAAAVARAKAKAKEKALAEPKEKPESKAKAKTKTEAETKAKTKAKNSRKTKTKLENNQEKSTAEQSQGSTANNTKNQNESQ